ncbi:unnamed protein product, partial [Coregonus sp. 'balchen']
MQTGTCDKPVEGVLLHTVPLTEVAESQQRAAEMGMDVKCDSTGEYSCPKLETCCKTSPTEWSCCPAPKRGGCSQQAELSWDIFYTHNKKRDFVPFGL